MEDQDVHSASTLCVNDTELGCGLLDENVGSRAACMQHVNPSAVAVAFNDSPYSAADVYDSEYLYGRTANTYIFQVGAAERRLRTRSLGKPVCGNVDHYRRRRCVQPPPCLSANKSAKKWGTRKYTSAVSRRRQPCVDGAVVRQTTSCCDTKHVGHRTRFGDRLRPFAFPTFQNDQMPHPRVCMSLVPSTSTLQYRLLWATSSLTL